MRELAAYTGSVVIALIAKLVLAALLIGVGIGLLI